MTKTTARRMALILATVLWMGVIFMFSSQPAAESAETSDKVIESVLSVTVKDYEDLDRAEQKELVGSYSLLTRKCAHFTAYLVLGVSVSLTLSSFGVNGRRSLLAGILICALYAGSDEIHQYFIPGRACRFYDVLIDTAGAAVGSAIVLLIRRLHRRRDRAVGDSPDKAP